MYFSCRAWGSLSSKQTLNTHLKWLAENLISCEFLGETIDFCSSWCLGTINVEMIIFSRNVYIYINHFKRNALGDHRWSHLEGSWCVSVEENKGSSLTSKILCFCCTSVTKFDYLILAIIAKFLPLLVDLLMLELTSCWYRPQNLHIGLALVDIGFLCWNN